MAAAAVATRKRPAPGTDGTDASAAGGEKKRARITLGTIYDYDKLEVLGQGTYGVVAKARHRGTGEAVAVKWAKESDLRAVLREAGCLAACRGHPSVVDIRDVVEDAATGDLFIVMEFVGTSLRSLLRQRRRFSEAETRGFVRHLLRGAEGMHGSGIIHRDIKPENILVGPGGALKICDLGLATPLRPEGSYYPELRVGTLLYRSPEQLAGCRDYGTGIDVWAIGCVMAELITGKFLFDKRNEEDMLTEVLDLRFEFIERGLQAFDELPAFKGLRPELSQAAREVLAGLLAFHPDDRLSAAAALQHQWFAEEEAVHPAASCFREGRAPRSSASVVTVLV